MKCSWRFAGCALIVLCDMMNFWLLFTNNMVGLVVFCFGLWFALRVCLCSMNFAYGLGGFMLFGLRWGLVLSMVCVVVSVDYVGFGF